MGKEEKQASVRRGIDAYRKVLKQTGLDADIVGGMALEEKNAAVDQDIALGLTAETLSFRPPKEGAADSRTRRVAKFLVLVGQEEAARILAELDTEQVEAISLEIAGIRGIGKDEGEEILAEFQELFATSYGWTGTSKGGVEEARKLLYVAFGREKGESLLRRVIPDGGENPFEFLENFTGAQIALLLRNEALATQTLVLSRLPPKLAAETLKNLAPDQKTDIVKRMAYLGKSSPDVVERVVAGLREKARRFADSGGEPEQEVDGMGALTAILKQSDVSFGEKLLAEMRFDNPDLSREIQDRLYTLDDLIHAEDRPIQKKLRSMNDRDIALLLKGRSAAFTGKIFANVSENRRVSIEEEGAWLGPVHRKDSDAEGRKFLDWFRKAREKGEILLATDEDVII